MKRSVILGFISLFSMAFAQETRHFYSQFGQDQFLNENIFRNKKNGIFVEFGAHDGIHLSNSYFFEKYLGWHGLCIEPMPNVFAALEKNRSCTCIQGCVAPTEGMVDFLLVTGALDGLSGIVEAYDPRHAKRLDEDLKTYPGEKKVIKVRSYTLNTLLQANELFYIDYLSIDTEGGELEILKSIDFQRFKIYVIGVENNYHESAIPDFLATKGFVRVRTLHVDDIFVNKELYLLHQGVSIDQVELGASLWDLQDLLARHKRNPANPDLLFALGQAYVLAGDLVKAADFYQSFVNTDRLGPDRFTALYRLGLIHHTAVDEKRMAWPAVLNYYLQAFEESPDRCEPLVNIANYYLGNDCAHLAYLFAYQACTLKSPEMSHMEQADLWQYARFDILARAAWQTGNLEIGRQAVNQALNARPGQADLLKLAQMYEKKLQHVRT